MPIHVSGEPAGQRTTVRAAPRGDCMRKALILSAAVVVGLTAGALWSVTAEAG